MDYYINKFCTITTVQSNFGFKNETMIEYFGGIVERIDDKGITLVHPNTRCKNYIRMAYVIGIHEEQMLFKDKPEDAKIIEEFTKTKPEAGIKVPEKCFVDVDSLMKISKQNG